MSFWPKHRNSAKSVEWPTFPDASNLCHRGCRGWRRYSGRPSVGGSGSDGSKPDFEKALRLDAQNADGYVGRAQAWLELRETHKAVADAAKVVEGKPREPRL
jgi:hypothetical protein